VHEHHKHNYPEEWLAITLSVCTSGNSIVAILAGPVGGIAQDLLGPVGPFDASIVFMLLGTFLIAKSWDENTGESHVDPQGIILHAWERLKADRKIQMLGIIQASFEGAMYIFVFMWVPALDDTSNTEIFHGLIFTTFMTAFLLGSILFRYYSGSDAVMERLLIYLLSISATALTLAGFIFNHNIRFWLFIIFEVCCGFFWPAIGLLRARYVPEEVRVTVVNFFRVPLNLMVIIVLLNIDGVDDYLVFSVCGLILLPGIIAASSLVNMVSDGSSTQGKKLDKSVAEQAALLTV
jgi:MFS family permease